MSDARMHPGDSGMSSSGRTPPHHALASLVHKCTCTPINACMNGDSTHHGPVEKEVELGDPVLPRLFVRSIVHMISTYRRMYP